MPGTPPTTRRCETTMSELDTSGQGLPPVELPRLKETPEYAQYPGLGTYYYGLNVKTVPDVKQRRAMALAIDRESIIDNIAQGDQEPATGFTPKGMPGFDTLTAKASRFTKPVEQAAGYALLSLLEPSRLDLRVEAKMDLSDGAAQSLAHYRAAGYAPFDVIGKGDNVAPIDGGLFSIDALLAGQ